MLLDLEDVHIKARVSPVGSTRIRLTLEYPRLPIYRDRILQALASLLHPAATTVVEQEVADHA